MKREGGHAHSSVVHAARGSAFVLGAAFGAAILFASPAIAGTHGRRPSAPGAPSRTRVAPQGVSAKSVRALATLSVTSTADSGAGSLRDVVAAAAPGDTVTFAVTGTIALTSGEITIPVDLAITGPGASQLAIDGGGSSSLFYVPADVTVSISGLALTGGYAAEGDGGAIYNDGTLTVDNCRLTGNTADFYGGAILNNGTLTITSSSLTGNTATEDYGGAIEDYGTLTIRNSTLSDNIAGSDGGAMSLDGGEATLVNVTFAHNSSGGIGGAIWGNDTPAIVHNTLVAENTDAGGAPDWHGVMDSLGHNLIGDTSDGEGEVTINGVTTGNLLNVTAGIAAIALNGAQTYTNALLPASIAIDAGDPAAGLSTDQRGVARLGAPDIGAYEAAEFGSRTIPALGSLGLALLGVLVAAAGAFAVRRAVA